MGYRRFLTGMLFTLTWFFSSVSMAQEMVFSAHVNASTVGLEDMLRLTFRLQNAPANTQYKPPSLSDFVVRGGPSQSQSTQVTNINGRIQQSSTVEVTYVLQAKRTGKLTIDPLEIIIDNKRYHTNSVTVEVVKGSVARQQPSRSQRGFDPFGDDVGDDEDDFWQQQRQMMQRMMQRMRQMQQQMLGNMPPGFLPDPSEVENISDLDEKNLHKNIFIKVEVDKVKPFVGEQITVKYKLYTRLNMNMQLTQLPSLNGFWSEDFKIPSPPQAQIEVVDGKKYNVFLLKKSALFPQQSGKLILDPAKAEGQVQVVAANASNPYYGYDIKNIHTSLESKPIVIDVQALPASGQPSNYTGAVGNFKVEAKVDPKTISTDQPGVLEFIISGTGNFKLIGSPEIDLPEALGATEPQIYDTILTRSPAITGKKTFVYYLSPQQAGNFTVPALGFSYFDPVSRTYKTLHTDPIEVTVLEGSGTKMVKGDQLPADIRGIETGKFKAYQPPTDYFTSSWYWALYGLALLAFLVVSTSYSRKNRVGENSALWKHKKANKVAWRRLAHARKLLNKNEKALFYEEVSKAIWLYLSDKLKIALSELNKENISGKLKENAVSSEVIGLVNRILNEVELALYTPQEAPQKRKELLEEVAKAISELENSLKTKERGLSKQNLI